MGWKWEVNQYVMVKEGYVTVRGGGYEYEQIYAGQWLLPAIWEMIKAKRNGSGCVKLEWR